MTLTKQLLAMTVCWSLCVAANARGEEALIIDAFGRIIPATAQDASKDSNATAAGDLYVEPSTLHSLGFEWNVQGDDNRNCRVTVEFRRAGDADWRKAEDLLRICGEKVSTLDKKLAYTCGNLYAGSILFLEPATQYEVKLALHDPDGGQVEKLLQVATKSTPKMFTAGRRLHVYPAQFEGQKQSPAFDNLATAYATCQPGDQILLHAGTYQGNFEFKKAGLRGRPIVVRDAGDGAAIITGSGNLFDVTHASHHWFHGLTFRGGAGAIYNAPGDVGIGGLTVTRCRFEDGYAGVFTRSTACRDIYIADNEFMGTKGNWHRNQKDKEPYKGVWLAGQGVDVCYNRVTNHWDGLSTLQSPPTDDFLRKLSAQDYYHNDVRQIVDDNEADYGQHNIRFFKNRLVDSHVGLSAQPFYGGPCYFVRNFQYNVTRGEVFKLAVQPAGVRIYNNTSVSTGTVSAQQVASLGHGWSNVHVYNNLFLGLNGSTLVGGPFDPAISGLDYNGYTFVGPIQWEFFDDRQQSKAFNSYKSFADFTKATGYERHSVAVSFKDLANVPLPRGEEADTDPQAMDARPVSGSAAVDAGMTIANITDGFHGKAPDLGAYEFGQELPHYGPRPKD
jgi:hypothetical protein